MSDLERAIELLHGGGHTCVLCRGADTHISDRTGIAPMMDFLDAGLDLNGYCVADRIVGKAAALLFVLAGVSKVYADTISEGACRVLREHRIDFSYQTLTPYIINRNGNGPCPMEEAVRDIEEPWLAQEAIRKTLQALKKEKEEHS